MKKWKIITACMILFLSGIVIGIFANSLYLHYKLPRMMKRGIGYYIQAKILPELDLSESQKKEIDPIVEKIDHELSLYRKEHRSGFRKILDQGFTEISQHLSEPQQKELERIREEKRRRWARKKD